VKSEQSEKGEINSVVYNTKTPWFTRQHLRDITASVVRRIVPVSIQARQLMPPFYQHHAVATPEVLKVARDTWSLVTANKAPEFLKRKGTDSFEYNTCIGKKITNILL
jgi:hypothetical protein